ncbi:MAG: 4-hydroxyphenylacetate 3-hydroxylase N-terminal domain-containing protein, partial [Pirellulales bacterium]
MQIKTKEDYVNSLQQQRHVVYYNGQRVEDVTTHPGFAPHINAAAKTYEMALRPEY